MSPRCADGAEGCFYMILCSFSCFARPDIIETDLVVSSEVSSMNSCTVH